MSRTFRWLSSGLLAAASLGLMTGAVHAQDAGAALIPAPVLSVDQVRGAFIGSGYRVAPAYPWDWTSPPVTSFQVDDTNGRVLMVLVYPSVAAAVTGRLQAETNERWAHTNASISAGAGPHLVVGYGQSAWNSNVALVQTTRWQLDRLDQSQADCDNGVYREPEVRATLNQPEIAVDSDFLRALQTGAVNL